MHNNSWRGSPNNRNRGNFKPNNVFQHNRLKNDNTMEVEQQDINSRLGNNLNRNYVNEQQTLSDGEPSIRQNNHNSNNRYNNKTFNRGRGVNSNRGRYIAKHSVDNKDYSFEKTIKIIVRNVPTGSPEDLVQFLQRKSERMFTPKTIRPITERKEVEIEIKDMEEANSLISLSGIRCGGEKLIITKENVPAVGNRIEQTIIKAVENRYVESVKYMDLSDFKNSEVLLKEKIFIKQRNWGLIMDYITNNKNQIQSINIENNNLKSINFMDRLRISNEVNLSLENNLLEDIKELNYIKHLNIKELILNNNPFKNNICVSHNGEELYRCEILKLFPLLRRLDRQTLSPHNQQNGLINDVHRQPIVDINNGGPPHIINNMGNFVNQFVEHYFNLYDHNRVQLSQYYNEKSVFSYTASSNNIQYSQSDAFKNGTESIQASGPNIMHALSKMPTTKHASYGNYTIEFNIHQSNSEATIVVITVYGKFEKEQLATECQFSRVFNVAINNNVPDQFLILNDMFTVHNEQQLQPSQTNDISNKQQTSSKEEVERHNMIIKMQTDTGLNYQFAAKCLDDNNWNYTQAYYIFDQLRKQGLVPQNAFQINN